MKVRIYERTFFEKKMKILIFLYLFYFFSKIFLNHFITSKLWFYIKNDNDIKFFRRFTQKKLKKINEKKISLFSKFLKKMTNLTKFGKHLFFWSKKLFDYNNALHERSSSLEMCLHESQSRFHTYFGNHPNLLSGYYQTNIFWTDISDVALIFT